MLFRSALPASQLHAQMRAGPELLKNPNLTGPFHPLALVNGAESITGSLPAGWIARTTPGDFTAAITNVAVKGKPAVKVTISRYVSGSLTFGQEVPALHLNHEYMYDVHLGGDGKTPVTLGVWGNNDPKDNFGADLTPDDSLGQDLVVFTVDEQGPTFCFVQFKAVGTYYVSGASVTASKSYPPG